MFLGRLFTKRILKTRDIKSLQLECGVLDIKKTYLNLNFYKQEFNHDIN
jgi:hypothetical protein